MGIYSEKVGISRNNAFIKKSEQPFYYAIYDAEEKGYDRDDEGNIKYWVF